MTSPIAGSPIGRPFTIVVGGFASNAGKTSLICRLLEAFPGWEAIKLTRDHHLHRGRPPYLRNGENLLTGSPIICSGRDENYISGKDTARFWDAGASNVHWIVSTEASADHGIRLALERVRSPGVFLEGNSFLRFMDADVAIMVARSDSGDMKSTALNALEKSDALFLTNSVDGSLARRKFSAWREKLRHNSRIARLPIYVNEDLPRLVDLVRQCYAMRFPGTESV
jgi:hypothetical protein